MRKEEFNIIDADFVEIPPGVEPQKKDPSTAHRFSLEEPVLTPEIQEKLSRVFDVDDRVKFDFQQGLSGTGTVLGLALDHVIKSYIILLDKPIQGQKAILVSNTLLEKIPNEEVQSPKV